MRIEIVHEENDFVICWKPRGILSQAGKPGQESMISLLSQQLSCQVHPVHRLDRDVSGIMVYAKNAKAAGEFGKLIQQGSVKKEYLAVVSGRPESDSGVLEDLLLHDAMRNKVFVVDRMRGGVKKAKLAYRVLFADDSRSLVQVRLYTGRTHQIRVQFSSRKMPLLGDGRYGGGKGEIALSSVRLGFPHPKTGKWCSYSRLPEQLGGISELPQLMDMD